MTGCRQGVFLESDKLELYLSFYREVYIGLLKLTLGFVCFWPVVANKQLMMTLYIQSEL